MFGQKSLYVRRIEGDIRGPLAKTAVLVDGLDPFGQKPSLGLVLLRVLTFDLKHERLGRCQPD